MFRPTQQNSCAAGAGVDNAISLASKAGIEARLAATSPPRITRVERAERLITIINAVIMLSLEQGPCLSNVRELGLKRWSKIADAADNGELLGKIFRRETIDLSESGKEVPDTAIFTIAKRQKLLPWGLVDSRVCEIPRVPLHGCRRGLIRARNQRAKRTLPIAPGVVRVPT